jgi:pyridoxal phosphate enzyme (YggS family)
MDIADNLARLEVDIGAACVRAGRPRREVTLVAVTKTRTPIEVDAAIAAGITDIGENRVQEALVKKAEVRNPARWHLVGSLQTNKVRRALDIFDIIESVDSLHLAEELQRRCLERGRAIEALVEVNTSQEPTKHGVAPDRALPFLEAILGLDAVHLVGLMTIGPGWAVSDPEASRPCFRALHALAAEARVRLGIPLPHLSMGMSSDFAVGIEEGATIIRVGTAIFGPRPG